MSLDFEALANEAIQNIRRDRDKVEGCLEDLLQWAKAGPDRHSEVAGEIAKYLETDQRSNEQLVKILGIMAKSQPAALGPVELSEEETESVFDKIAEQKNNG